MQLDKATGAQRFTISARALQIPRCKGSRRASLCALSNCSKEDKRIFSEDAQFYRVNELEIRGKIQKKMLSQNTTYAAYLVFKLAYAYYEYDFPYEVASVGVAGRESTQQVCVQGWRGSLNCDAIPPEEEVHFPHEKADGWMEVELGEFHNEEGDSSGEVSISFMGESKSGLTVLGIELRSKQQKPT
ncbi:F-box protein PP2-B13 [Triticum aestivum]|uniref:F-box protein PP2-B13 n=1 Tax=Triticum aestivum TaxID=4565 RepID=UPI001D01F6D7|nr:F-box protein PP2-B13-like [Triticum aestivum]